MPRRYKRPYWPEITFPDDINPRAVREKFGWTQSRLARMLGVSVRTVQGWEANRWRKVKPGEKPYTGYCWADPTPHPTTAAKILLALIDRDPWIIYDVLSGQLKPRGDQQPSWLDM